MARPTSISTLAALVLAATASPAAAANVNLRARVPTICEVQATVTDEAASARAELVVFCNAPGGARLSGVMIGDDAEGYLVSHQAGAFVAAPGAEFDIRSYASAFAGREYLQISSVSGDAAAAPTILFQIIPEG